MYKYRSGNAFVSAAIVHMLVDSYRESDPEPMEQYSEPATKKEKPHVGRAVPLKHFEKLALNKRSRK